MKKTKIGIILLNYFGIKDTTDVLNSLKKINTKGIEPFFVVLNSIDKGKDQAPNQGQQLKKLFPFIHVIQCGNLGFSGSHNLGAKFALENNCDEIVWLNNDTTVHKDFLIHLHQAVKDKSVGAACPKIYFSRGKEFHQDDYKDSERGKVIWYAGGLIDWNNVYAYHRGVDEVDHGQFDVVEETDFVTGCCIITRKDILEKVDFLTEKLFLYIEDADWSMRVKNMGYKLLYYPPSIIWHKNAGSTKGAGSPLHVYYQTRNRLYFGFKYASLKTKLALVKESIRKYNMGSNAEQKGIKHFFIGKFGMRHNE